MPGHGLSGGESLKSIEDIDDIKNDFEVGFRAARKPRLVSNQ